MIKRGIIICLALLLFHLGQAQQLAFPGAEGGGKFSAGGRTGTVYEVTNLNDSGPGSLRDAITSGSNRTVVFRVSGVIHLASTLKFTQDNITVAGQTAPGDGICITGYTVSIQASNIIVRYLRSRLGDETLIEDDAMHSTSGPYQNIIVDHCSLSWSVDETGTFYDIKNFTLQWSILSESLYHSVHDKGDHGYAGIWGGNNATFHHNLLAHHTSRNPRFNGSRYSGQPSLEMVDFVNNVLYNWGNINSAYGGEGGNYNMMNNYYKPGPATPGSLTTSSSSNKRNRILNYTSYYYASDAAVYPDTLFGGKFYINGNYVKGYPDVTADNWTKGVQKDSYKHADQLIVMANLSGPISMPNPIVMQSAEEAYASILNSVGATFPVRDALDARIIREVQTGTATFEGAAYAAVNDPGVSHPSGIIDTPGDVGGLPVYNSIAAPTDTDHDGMPDAWETLVGLNPNNILDGNGDINSNGYTNLEDYLNSLVAPQSLVATIGSLGSFSQSVGNPSTSQTFTVYGSNLTADVVITPPAGFEVSIDGSTWVSLITLTQSGGVVKETTISVRLNAGASGFSSGNISIASTGASSVNIPVAGATTTPSVPPVGAKVVAKVGGDYTTVQAAIDAAPTGLTSPYIIYIKKGVYKEKITVPSNKPFLQFIGESVSGTILTYDDYSGKPIAGGGTIGTSNSASVTINATDFSAINITFENTTGDAPQALAINVNADRSAFANCRFLGGQDTVLSNGTGNRQYFWHTYIDGVVDFIFGNATTILDSCVVYAKSREDGLNSSYITAANTQPGQAYGFVFRNAVLPSNMGVTKYVLGRPWQNATGFSPVTYPHVVFLNATLGNLIKPEGWAIWDAGTITSSIYDAEYKSRKFNGNLADVSNRINWSFQLSDPDAAPYANNATIFGSSTWDPCSVSPVFCNNVPRDIAVSNFKGKKGATTSSLTWNISWAMKDIKYELFRSSDNVSFSKVNEQLAVNDTTVNFAYSENIPPAGSTFYYFLVASKAGKEPHVTSTISISSTPTVTVTGTLNNFTQGFGTPSSVQAYSLSGINLTSDVTVKPPTGFEISTDGANWFTNASPLVLHQSGGNLAATSISVRLNASVVGNYSGTISHTATGATTALLAVQGVLQQDPLSPSTLLQYWPLLANNQDDPTSRSVGVTTSTSSMKRLTLSNGTTPPGLLPYSSNGQAFGPSSDGSGTWTVAAGGSSSTLNRGIYEQFKVTASAGYAVRIDSIGLKSSFYNTSSNTKLAVVFSKSGFTSNDSTDVSGGAGAGGVPLISTANGAFATPVLLTNETSGTTVKYAFSTGGGAGIQLNPGQSLTIRLYFACGSTSQGRYAKLKDVYIKGFAAIKAGITTTGTLAAFAQVLGTPSPVQTFSASGVNLTGSISITPPTGYEISQDGTTWKGPSSPITLAPSGGTVSPKTISVRLNSSIRGSVGGNIVLSSAGADNVNVALSGTVNSPTTVTGFESVKPEDFSVSPNPTSRYLNLYHPAFNGSYQITLISAMGQRLGFYTTNPKSGEIQIDVQDLSTGLYLIEWNGNGVRIIRRFIKL